MNKNVRGGILIFLAFAGLMWGQELKAASNCGDADSICRNRYRECSSCVECCTARYSCAVRNCNKLQEPYRYNCLMLAERGCGGE